MRAYIADEKKLCQIERPIPVLKGDEVLIDVHFSGINRPDLLQRDGLYAPPKGETDILGLEVSGVIVAVGDSCQKFAVGDPVCALLVGGGFADQVAVFEDHVLRVPNNVTLAEAAGLLEVFATVWLNLIHYAGLKFGERCLIHGGASGIGMAGIQIAKFIGAEAITTISSKRKEEFAQACGADFIINYREEDFATVLQQKYPEGVDVVLDIIGGKTFEKNLEILGYGGRHVSLAFLENARASVKIPLLMRQSLHLMGSMLRPRSWEEKAKLLAELQQNLWPAFEARELTVKVDKLFPFEALEDAFSYMEQGILCGKIVLDHEKKLS